jgi:hypothetical protein
LNYQTVENLKSADLKDVKVGAAVIQDISKAALFEDMVSPKYEAGHGFSENEAQDTKEGKALSTGESPKKAQEPETQNPKFLTLSTKADRKKGIR